MTFTYGGNPQTSSADAVRLEIGDTDEANALLQDGEIAYFLGGAGNPLSAAADAARAIAAKFARLADFANGASRVQASQRATAYLELAERLRERANRGGMQAFAGAVDQADHDGREQDDTLVPPDFRKDMWENTQPGTISADALVRLEL